MSKITANEKQTVSGFASLALSTLASRTALVLAGPGQNGGGTFISTKTAMVILSADQFDGPFLVGVATGNLSAAQIEAAIENNGPAGMGHSDLTEIATRFRHIRTMGIIDLKDGAGIQPGTKWIDEAVKLGWTEGDGGWNWWIYNLGPTLVAGATWEVTERDFVIYDKD